MITHEKEKLHVFFSLFLIESFQEPFVAVCLSIYIALTSLNERECVEISSILFMASNSFRSKTNFQIARIINYGKYFSE